MKLLNCLFVSLLLSPIFARAGALAVIVPHSFKSQVDRNALADVFLDRRSRWDDGTSAKPVDQAEGSEPRNRFYQILVNRSSTQMKAYWAQMIFTGKGNAPHLVEDSAAVKKYVAATPGSVGYIEKEAVDSTVRVLLEFDE